MVPARHGMESLIPVVKSVQAKADATDRWLIRDAPAGQRLAEPSIVNIQANLSENLTHFFHGPT